MVTTTGTVMSLLARTGAQMAAVWRLTISRRWSTVVRISDSREHSSVSIRHVWGRIWSERITLSSHPGTVNTM